jgi:hypothetical protein
MTRLRLVISRATRWHGFSEYRVCLRQPDLWVPIYIGTVISRAIIHGSKITACIAGAGDYNRASFSPRSGPDGVPLERHDKQLPAARSALLRNIPPFIATVDIPGFLGVDQPGLQLKMVPANRSAHDGEQEDY